MAGRRAAPVDDEWETITGDDEWETVSGSGWESSAHTLERPLASRAAKGLGDFAVGAAKGAGSTVYNLGKLAHKIPGMDVIAPDTAGAFSGPNEITRALEPTNNWQTAGKMAEQVGEFFLPAGAAAGKLAPIANAVKGLGTAGRIGQEAVSAAGVTAAQGGDPVAGGIAGGVGSGIAAGAGKLAPRIMNSLLQPKKAAFVTGANPGRGVANEGVMAGSLGSLVKKIEAAEKKVGGEIGTTLGLSAKGRAQTIDAAPLFDKPIAEAKASLNVVGESTAALDNMRKGIYDAFTQMGVSPNNVSPAQLFIVKKAIRQSMKYTGTEGVETSTKEVKKLITHRFAKAIEDAVPEIAPLNKRYSDLAEASTAVWDRLHTPQSSQIMSPSNIVAGSGAGLAYLMSHPGIAAAILGTKAVTSITPTATAAAQGARAMGSPAGQAATGRMFGAAASGLTREDEEDAYLRSLMRR